MKNLNWPTLGRARTPAISFVTPRNAYQRHMIWLAQHKPKQFLAIMGSTFRPAKGHKPT